MIEWRIGTVLKVVLAQEYSASMSKEMKMVDGSVDRRKEEKEREA